MTMDASLQEVTQVLSGVVELPQQGPCLDKGGRIDVCDLTELSKQQHESEEKQKIRTYWFIVWPESVDMAKLFQVLNSSGYAIAVSPLHDKDLKDEETGELAKPHYHIIVRFPTPRYLEPVRRLVGSWIFDADGLSASPEGEEMSWYVRPVPDYPTALRYLVHKDSPEKHRYPESEVITFGFIDISMLYEKTLADDVESYYRLIAWCRNNGGKSYAQLVDAVYDTGDRALMRTLTRYSYALKGYLADRGRPKKGA